MFIVVDSGGVLMLEGRNVLGWIDRATSGG